MSIDRRNEDIGARKARHLEICVQEGRYSIESGSTGFDHIRLLHCALPELSEGDVDTSANFIGHLLQLPIFISSMTGGSDAAYQVNKDLAAAAQSTGIAVGTGSIRILFRKPEVLPHFQLKKIAPDVPVFANIGAVQIRDEERDKIIELVKRLEVQALAVHLNPGQELFQPEGDHNFSEILPAIARFCEKSPFPVIIKETGFGIRPDEVNRLLDAGAAYIDVAGSGGTNWIAVEGYRLDSEEHEAAREFDDWGTPTALILGTLNLRQSNGRQSGRILASGGLRTGMDLAKAIALGASLGGYALPFARAVTAEGVEGAVRLIRRFARVLRSAMILTGSRNLSQLRRAPILLDAEFEHQIRSMRAVLDV